MVAEQSFNSHLVVIVTDIGSMPSNSAFVVIQNSVGSQVNERRLPAVHSITPLLLA